MDTSTKQGNRGIVLNV